VPHHDLSSKDQARLTQAQRSEYERLKSNVASPPPNAGESWLGPFLPGLVAGLVALIIFLMTVFALLQSSWLMLVMAAEGPLLFGGWLLVTYIGSHRWNRKRRPEHERALTAFVDANRPRETAIRTGWDDDTRTERQSQHDWYGSHTELDWRDRKAAATFGMTSDEWSSNMSGD
jgi:predicted lipid-binding transport protein (Tim44 family)